MILNIAAIDESLAAGTNCPTVVIVLAGDTGIGGEAEIGGTVHSDSVAVIYDDTLIGVVLRDCRTGRIVAGKYGYVAAGSLGNACSFVAILVGKVVVVAAVVGSDKQDVGRACILASIGNNGGFALDFNVLVKLIAKPEIVCVVHSVNSKEEAVLAHVGKAVDVDESGVECCAKNGGNDLGLFCAACDCFRFGCVELSPNVIELGDRRCFVCNACCAFRKTHNGDDCEQHDDCKDYGKDSAILHFVFSILYFVTQYAT